MAHNINGNSLWQPPSFLQPQADILSTPAEIKSDDAEVAALMMEADITAPIKEQCEENARLMREIVELKRDMDALRMDNMRLERKLDATVQAKNEAQSKADKYDAAVSLLAELVNDLRA